MSTVDRSHRAKHRRLRVVATALPLAVLVFGGGAFGTGAAFAAPGDQAGVTDTPQSDQAGVTTPSSPGEQAGVMTPPAPTPPPRPQETTPFGAVLPEPAPEIYYGEPEQYVTPPSYNGGGYGNGGYSDGYSGGGYGNGGGYAAPAPEPDSSLSDDLAGLHAPAPVEPPKVIVPAPPDRLGLGEATIPRPDWVGEDAAWKINGLISQAQRDTNQLFNSIGFSSDRSSRMATGTVLGASSGALVGAMVAGVPAAVVGGVGGGLIGGTIGGVAGAAAGTLVPVPVIGTVTSGVAGTAAGAAIGAAAGAAALGVPAALAGGAVGGVIGGVAGAVSTAGDGSDFTPPPEVPPQPAPPAPSLHDQAQATVDNTIASAEGAVAWASEQPGGQEALDSAADAVDTTVAAVQEQPWAPAVADAGAQAAQDAIAWAQTQEPIADVVDAAVDVISETPPLAPGQLGPFTDQVNAGLAGIQAAIGG